MIRWFLFASLLTLGNAFAADFSVKRYAEPSSVKEYVAARDAAKSSRDRLQTARDFQNKLPDDIPLQILVSNDLAFDNLEQARSFYVNRSKGNPSNIAAHFLSGRMMDSPQQRMEYADRILALDKNSYWGNLLLGSSLTPEMDPGFTKAEASLRSAIAADNSLPFAVAALAELYVRKGDVAAADKTYLKLGEMQPDKFEPVQFRLMLHPGEYSSLLKWIDEFLDKNPTNIAAMNTRAAVQREQSDWTGYLETNRRIVNTEKSGESCYNLGCAFAINGQADSAFAWLNAASDGGYDDLAQYRDDDDLTSLKSDPRWSELLDRIEANQQKALQAYMSDLVKNAGAAKEQAVGERSNQAAPDFTFSDLNGKNVSLSKLRGKVVILDFWATWCGPCRRTMPLLNEYFTTTKPADVEVFGVNVWERNPAAVKPMIEQGGYKFPILLGDDKVAGEYGVRGIPTLVVIDKNGNIAFRHVGADPGLIKKLEWQVGELNK